MKKISAETLLEYKFVSNLRYCKEKEVLAFVKSKGNLDENKYDRNIYIYDLKTDELKEMTYSDEEGSFEFFNGEIIFPTKRDKKDKELIDKGFDITSYYTLPLDGGEARKAFTIPVNVADLEVIDEKTLLIQGIKNIKKPDVSEILKLEGEERAKAIAEGEEKIKEESEIIRLHEIPFWSDGGSYTDGNRYGLYLFHVESGELEKLTEDEIGVSSFSVKDGEVLFTYTETGPVGIIENNIGRLDLNEKKWEKIFSKDNHFFNFVGRMDGEIFVTAVNMNKHELKTNPDFCLIKDGELEIITPEDFDYSLGLALNTDVAYGGNPYEELINDKYYFISTQRIDTYLCSIDKEGNIEKEIPLAGSIEGFAVGKDAFYTVSFRGDKLEEVYEYKDGDERQLTHFNDFVQKEYEISTPEYIEINREDFSLDGFIIKPPNFEKGKKYKTILEIHGGPMTTYGSNYFHEMQYLASLGYVIIFTNPRGSDGRGNEFGDIRGKYGDIDYDDLMYFTKEMVKIFPFIDEERMGVTGGSYGGYMTNWIVGHTDYFKAAVTQRSISNWFSKYNITDIGYYFAKDQVGTTPWENPEKMWDNSPLKYADKVKTPTLIIHSEQDYRCDVGQGYQFFTALKLHGVECEMFLVKGESHGLSRMGRPKQRIKRLEAMADWFERYI